MLPLRTLILTLFISLSLPASASAGLEQQLYDLKLSIRLLLLQYYHVQADEQNTQLQTELARQLDSAEQQQLNVSAALRITSGQPDPLPPQWQTFRQLMQQNVEEIRNSAFPELQVVMLMREAAHTMVRDIDTIASGLAQKNELTLTEAQHWSRQQQMYLLDVTETYLERAASSMGANFTIGVNINERCRLFSDGLNGIQADALPADARDALARVQSQWVFIERTARDPEARLVPFLVMRYTRSILDQLNKISAVG